MTPQSKEEIAKAWEYLRAEITDRRATKKLDKSVYGIDGLTDVKDWFLWERLEKSGLRWELNVSNVLYLGSEDRTRKSGGSTYQQRYYLVSAEGTLIINGRPFPCVGAGENRRLDAAYKGAVTSLFKNGCKWAGLTMSIYKDAPIDDDYFDTGEEGDSASSSVQSRSATINPMDAVQRATEILDGKVVSVTPAQEGEAGGPPPAIDKLTAEKFTADPLNRVRVGILKELNLIEIH